MRDSQRGRLYAAERKHSRFPQTAYRAGRTVGQAPDLLPTVEECQAFIDRVTGSAWFRKRHGRRTIRVSNSQGKGGACAGVSTIWISAYFRTPLILLHELAHCLRYGKKHGREFARTYVQLVTRFMGAAAGAELRACFKAGRVRYSKPRVLTPAQRQALAARRDTGALSRWRAEQLAARTRSEPASAVG